MAVNKFIDGKEEIVFSQCNRCKHRISVKKCTAFTKEIPRIILSNKFAHTKPFVGDNGIQFEEKDTNA